MNNRPSTTEMLLDSKKSGRYIRTQRFITLSMTPGGPGGRGFVMEMVNMARHLFSDTLFRELPWDQPDLEIAYRERGEDGRITLEICCFPFTGEVRVHQERFYQKEQQSTPTKFSDILKARNYRYDGPPMNDEPTPIIVESSK